MSKKLNKAAALLLDAYKRHPDNPDWYGVQLSVATAYTKGDIKKTIALADAMYEANPQPPAITDEHEVAAQQDLASHLSEQSASFSLGAAFASTDWRGVEHRGKGSSRGGQFVRKGEGEADVNESAGGGSQGSSPSNWVEEIDAVGDSSPDPDSNQAQPDDEVLDAIEVVEDEEGDFIPPFIQEYNVNLSPEEMESFQAIVNHYPEEQRDIANRLISGKAIDHNMLSGGCNGGTSLLHLKDGTRGVFKPMTGEALDLRSSIPQGTYYKREIASSLVAHLLGFGDLVPVTVPRARVDSHGSMQAFVDNVQTAHKYGDGINLDMEYGSDEDVARAALFDYITGNTDRHTGNWMIQDPELQVDPNDQSEEMVDIMDPVSNFAALKPERSLSGVPGDQSDEAEPTGPFQKWEGETGVRPGDIPEELPKSVVEALPASESKENTNDKLLREWGMEPDSTGEGSPVVDIPPGGVDLPGKKDYSKNKMVLIDNGLSFPTRHVPHDFVNTKMMKRAIQKNLPMPDISHMQEAWPQVEAALKQSGLEPAAIDRTKQRFFWATSGGAKTIGDLKNPFESHNRQQTLRKHFDYYGL